jgi:hypothetical protein
MTFSKRLNFVGLLVVTTITASSMLLGITANAQTAPDTSLNINPSTGSVATTSETSKTKFTTAKCELNRNNRNKRVTTNIAKFGARLAKVEANIQKFIDNAKAQGKDTTTIQSDLANLKVKVDSAMSAHQALADAIKAKDCASFDTASASEKLITTSRENAIGTYTVVRDYLKSTIKADIAAVRKLKVVKKSK